MSIRFGFLLLCLLSFSNFVAAQTPVEKLATASVSGRITAGDRPVPEVLLTLQSVTQSRPIQRETYNTKSDEDGNFKFTKVKAGRYTLIPNALGYIPTSASGRAYQPQTIIVNDGESLDQQDIKLTAGGVITGRITDDDGRPIIEQRISLLRKEASGKISRTYNGAFNHGLFFTDDRGIYRMYGLSAGKYVVAIGEDNIYSGISVSNNFSSRYPFTFYPSVTAEEKAEEVEVSEGGEVENVDIRIGKAKPIFVAKGKIIEATSSQPIVGVRYRLGRLLTDDRNEKRANAWMIEAARTNKW